MLSVTPFAHPRSHLRHGSASAVSDLVLLDRDWFVYDKKKEKTKPGTKERIIRIYIFILDRKYN